MLSILHLIKQLNKYSQHLPKNLFVLESLKNDKEYFLFNLEQDDYYILQISQLVNFVRKQFHFNNKTFWVEKYYQVVKLFSSNISLCEIR